MLACLRSDRLLLLLRFPDDFSITVSKHPLEFRQCERGLLLALRLRNAERWLVWVCGAALVLLLRS